ncbi:DoxX family protein [Pseudoxanthomonas beigongshangi]
MRSLLNGYPWIRPETSLHLLRMLTAVLFMAHAAVRITNGTIPRFAEFMELQGFPYGAAWVWIITLYELTAGTLLILNIGVRWAASGLALIAAVGILLIHWKNGWFVGEHGVGGSEYSVALLAMLLVVAAHDARRQFAKPAAAAQVADTAPPAFVRLEGTD